MKWDENEKMKRWNEKSKWKWEWEWEKKKKKEKEKKKKEKEEKEEKTLSCYTKHRIEWERDWLIFLYDLYVFDVCRSTLNLCTEFTFSALSTSIRCGSRDISQ